MPASPGSKPESREYTVWDARAAGFGVRVRPNGSRSYVCCCRFGDRARKFSLGPAALKSVGSARRECLVLAGTEAPAPPNSSPAVPGVRRGALEDRLLRPVQAVDEKRRRLHSRNPVAAGFRKSAAPSDRPDRDRRMVRRLQPDRSGRSQQGAQDAAPDFELRDRLRLHRVEPGPVRETKPAPQAHPVPFARGNPPPASGSGRLCERENEPPGGHDPPPAVDRLPQGRDRRAAVAGLRRRHAQSRGQQDGTAQGSAERRGSPDTRKPAASGKPIRFSLSFESRAAPARTISRSGTG